MYWGKKTHQNPNHPTNKQTTQPRPMNRFEIILGPVSLANTTPESTCKQGRGRKKEAPRKPQRPGADEAGGRRGATEPRNPAAPSPRHQHPVGAASADFAASPRGCECVCVQIRLSGR